MPRIAAAGSGPSGVYTAQALLGLSGAWRDLLLVDVLDRMSWTGCRARTAWCGTASLRTTRSSRHSSTVCAASGAARGAVPGQRAGRRGRRQPGGGETALPRGGVGAARDRRLGIPGGDLAGSGPATDMPQAPLEALAASGVREVDMAGRRGPSQARFTTKELRELGTLPGVRAGVVPGELAAGPGCADPAGLPGRRGCGCGSSCARPRSLTTGAARRGRCAPSGPRPAARGAPAPGGPWRSRPAWYCGRSATGCRSTRTAERSHAAGRVLRDGAASPGEHVAGWIKRGPSGVIGSNRPCAQETVFSLLADREVLGPLDAAGGGTRSGRVARKAAHRGGGGGPGAVAVARHGDDPRVGGAAGGGARRVTRGTGYGTGPRRCLDAQPSGPVG